MKLRTQFQAAWTSFRRGDKFHGLEAAARENGEAEERAMFVAVYWWRVHPGKEAQFRAAWRRGTELITKRYGSFGSRLHRAGDGRFVGVAEWPDEATWRAAFDAKMAYDEPETRRAFLDAIAEAPAEPLLLMEVTDDLLERTGAPGKAD